MSFFRGIVLSRRWEIRGWKEINTKQSSAISMYTKQNRITVDYGSSKEAGEIDNMSGGRKA